MKTVLLLLAIVAVLNPAAGANAQQPAKVPAVGVLYVSGMTLSPEQRLLFGFRRQLQDLGYVEGKTIRIEYRFSGGDVGRVPELSMQLLELGVDVIVTSSVRVVRLIRQITESVPIVMVASFTPADVIETLSKPGRNVTGPSVSPEISRKQLELLRETVPRLNHVAVLFHRLDNSRSHEEGGSFQATKIAAGNLGLKLYPLEFRTRENLEALLEAGRTGPADGLLVLGSPLVNASRTAIIAFAEKNRLPAIYHRKIFPEEGGLMSYAPDNRELWRQAAFYVDKILKGAKPAELPAEHAAKLELVVNLKAAQKIGISFPDTVLRWADEVIR